MNAVDPSTGRPLPFDAIQRILFVARAVHVYNIPPLASTKGYVAATWTEDNNKRQIFTARLRVLETAVPHASPTSEPTETVKTDILLEDPKTGDLFAAAPYTDPAVVEQVLDSSRFFALRVQGEGGRKAVLGIGFEERPEAFDFSVALQEVRRTLGLELKGAAGAKPGSKGMIPGPAKGEKRQDFSLKEGETITVNIGGRGTARKTIPSSVTSGNAGSGSFSLPPPPGGSGSFLPPPPSAQEVKTRNRLSQNIDAPKEAESIGDLGFDDGEFGEFQ